MSVSCVCADDRDSVSVGCVCADDRDSVSVS